jgi:ATP-dependent helicase/nuclease subunit A
MQSEKQPPPPYWIEWSPLHELGALRTAPLDEPVELITAIPDRTIGQEQASAGEASRKLSAGSKRVLEGYALAARINQMVDNELVTDAANKLRPVRYGDIVVLLRAFTDVAIYERSLRDKEIPCCSVKGRGFFACQEVLDFIELLTAVDDPSDSMALVACLRSPFFAVSDDSLAEIAFHREGSSNWAEHSPADSFSINFLSGGPAFSWLFAGRDDTAAAWRILEELRRLRQRGSIVAVVDHALAATCYEAVMLGLQHGVQRAANLRKLADLARDFESRRLFTFHDFVVYLRRLAEHQPYEPSAQILGENENVVRLMTVHQAKGLEFPVVILADAGRRSENDVRSPVTDPERGLLLRDAVGSGMDEIPNQMMEEFRQRSGDEQQAESLRLLYVALTRARDRLIISEGAMVQGWAKKLRSFLGDGSCASFVSSNSRQLLMERAGATILLRQPADAQSSPGRSAAAGSPHTDWREFSALAQRRLSFESPQSEELVISPTALADFDRCPRQFHFRHGLRLPEDDRGGINGASGDASAMGNVAHAVLERFQAEPPDKDEMVELVNLFGAGAGLDAEQLSSLVVDLWGFVNNFAENVPAKREVPFFYNAGQGLFVRGQIDALVYSGECLVVRDYKYARPAVEAGFYQVQMEAYALAVADAYPGSRVEAEIVFLKDGCAIVPVTLPPLLGIRNRILSIGRDIIAARVDGNFFRKPSGADVCRQLRCGYVERCWRGNIWKSSVEPPC